MNRVSNMPQQFLDLRRTYNKVLISEKYDNRNGGIIEIPNIK